MCNPCRAIDVVKPAARFSARSGTVARRRFHTPAEPNPNVACSDATCDVQDVTYVVITITIRYESVS